MFFTINDKEMESLVKESVKWKCAPENYSKNLNRLEILFTIPLLFFAFFFYCSFLSILQNCENLTRIDVVFEMSVHKNLLKGRYT